MQWFRLYSDILNDIRLYELSDADFRLWVNLLALASENNPRGYVPSLKVCEFRLHIERSELQTGIGRLIQARLLDKVEDGELRPHNWDGRQPRSDNVAERVRKSRNSKPKTVDKPEENVTLQVTVLSNGSQSGARTEQNRTEQNRTETDSTLRVEPARDDVDEIETELSLRGMDARQVAEFTAPETIEETRRQLAWLPLRSSQSVGYLVSAIRRKYPAPTGPTSNSHAAVAPSPQPARIFRAPRADAPKGDAI